MTAPPGEVPTLSLHPKHPGAADASPVKITIEVDESSTVGAAFAKNRAYGLIDPVRLPGEVVSKFEVDGPEFVVSGLSDRDLGYLEVHPDSLFEDPRPLFLAFHDADERPLKTARGKVPSAAIGPQGVTIRQEFYDGCLIIDWRLSKDPTEPAHVSVSQDLSGSRSPEQVRDTTSLVLALNELSANMRLVHPNGTQLAQLSMGRDGSTPHGPSDLDDMRKLKELAEDLIAIQDLCGRQFNFPHDASDLDRIDARICRRLLEGRVVCIPEAQLLHLKIKPEALGDNNFATFLNDPSHLMVEQNPFPWTLEVIKDQGSQAEIVIDEPLNRFFPELVADNAAEVLDALGRGEVAELNLRSPSQLRPRYYMKNRLQPSTPIVPEPWGLIGVAEVPELRDPPSKSTQSPGHRDIDIRGVGCPE